MAKKHLQLSISGISIAYISYANEAEYNRPTDITSK